MYCSLDNAEITVRFPARTVFFSALRPDRLRFKPRLVFSWYSGLKRLEREAYNSCLSLYGTNVESHLHPLYVFMV